MLRDYQADVCRRWQCRRTDMPPAKSKESQRRKGCLGIIGYQTRIWGYMWLALQGRHFLPFHIDGEEGGKEWGRLS